MISQKLQSALNDQINAELWSAYMYLSMSLHAETQALKGMAQWLYVQWQEEQDHARIFQNFMNDNQSRVVLQPVSSVPVEWESPLQMFHEALQHEEKVTQMIEQLVQMAYRERNLPTLSRLQWFVDEQVEEEASLHDVVARLEMVSDNPAGIQALDDKLATRTYEPAAPLCK